MKRFRLRSCLITTIILAAIGGTIGVPVFIVGREAARETHCSNNLKMIAIALMSYESAYRHLPLAVEIKNDKLWRSWRSQLYPGFLEQMPPVYDPSVAWDSEKNLRLIDGTPVLMATDKGGEKAGMFILPRVPWWYGCPSCTHGKGLGGNYVVVRGDLTAFPMSTSIQLADITDGLENTILIVESINCTPDWTEPRDLEFDTMDFIINSSVKPSISSGHPSGALVCFADTKTYCVTPRIAQAELRALLTIAGGENATREDLVKRGILIKR